MSKVINASSALTGPATGQTLKARILEAFTCFLKEELDSLKRRESAVCNAEVVSRKVANAKSNMNHLIDGLRQGTFKLYAFIQYCIDQSLVAVSERRIVMSDRKAMMLQQGVHDDFCNAASGVQTFFEDF